MKFYDYRMLAKRFLGLLCIGLLAAAMLVPLLRSSSSDCTREEPGVLDLTSCVFTDGLTVELNGQWAFYWSRLLNPQTAAVQPSGYVPVPRAWTSLPQQEDYPRYGFATYRLTLLLPEERTSYMLKINNIRTSSIVYVNSEALGGSGVPGASKLHTTPQNKPYTVSFTTRDSKADLLIHTANFSYNNGGIVNSVQIGSPEAIQGIEQRNRTYDTMLVAGFLFMGVYFFGQGFQRQEDRSSLQLAMYCLTISLFLLTHSEKMLMDLIPSLSYEWFSKLQMISGVVGFYFVSGYTYSLFPALYSRTVHRISLVYSLVVCVFTLISDIRVYSSVANPLLVFSILSVCYTFYVMGKAVLLREIGSFYLLIGAFAAILFTLTLTSSLFLGTDFYAIPPIAGPVFVLAEGLFLSARQAYAYDTIKQLSQQLERKDRDKDEFLLKTSNELRTPLNAIINISLSLYEEAGGALSPSQREDVRLILGTGRRLAFLVRDLLDYEQLRHRRIKLYWKIVDIQSVASVVIEVFQFLNKKGEIRIKNRIPPGIFLVVADEQRLMQILYNLLDNALKFTDRGSVVFEAEQRDSFVHVTVSDTGRGIPGERLESIFRDYEQVHEAESLESSGLGLGLAITKKLIQLHGGTITVSSAMGRGSRFTFTVPVTQENIVQEEAEDSELLIAPIQSPYEDSRAALETAAAVWMDKDGTYIPRILIVDDDYANLKALTNLLTMENYMITSARTGKEALAALENNRDFDLCILDVMMPEMSGLELCGIIRRTYSPLDLPVLMATAGQQLHFNESAFRAGANDFIHKPYAWSDLKGRVKTLIELRRSVSERLNSEIAMLRAQIKPHFLYNAINTIIWMSSRDNEKTRQLLYNLSHFLRGSFDFGNQETAVPFEKELELIEAYLSLEQARFGKRLTVQYDIGVSEFSLPPLIVQPIVENAVRHGLMEKINGGTVTISTRKEGDHTVITVADNGKGMSDEQLSSWMNENYVSPHGEGTGIGLKNINRRLLKQFGQPMRITRGTHGGIEVNITIPWE